MQDENFQPTEKTESIQNQNAGSETKLFSSVSQNSNKEFFSAKSSIDTTSKSNSSDSASMLNGFSLDDDSRRGASGGENGKGAAKFGKAEAGKDAMSKDNPKQESAADGKDKISGNEKGINNESGAAKEKTSQGDDKSVDPSKANGKNDKSSAYDYDTALADGDPRAGSSAAKSAEAAKNLYGGAKAVGDAVKLNPKLPNLPLEPGVGIITHAPVIGESLKPLDTVTDPFKFTEQVHDKVVVGTLNKLANGLSGGGAPQKTGDLEPIAELHRPERELKYGYLSSNPQATVAIDGKNVTLPEIPSLDAGGTGRVFKNGNEIEAHAGGKTYDLYRTRNLLSDSYSWHERKKP